MTFKKGDVLRCVSPGTYAMTEGSSYVARDDAKLIGLDMHVNVEDDNGRPIAPFACRFKLAQTMPDNVQFDLLAAVTGKPLKFRSGCAVKFVAYVPDAKPHCQLVLLNVATGNVVLRYASGKGSDEPYNEPGDILNA